jgi:8-oxo-dGTP diphosphatase
MGHADRAAGTEDEGVTHPTIMVATVRAVADDQIEAAGGLVIRTRKGRREVLVVHRPKYDDWTLPKGKLEDGEKARDAALREVLEETGHHCRAGDRLPSVRYEAANGRPKRVRYWLMEVDHGEFVENDEVDEIRWWSADKAAERLSYPHDQQLVTDALLATSGNTSD